MLDFKNAYYNTYGYLPAVKVKLRKDVFSRELDNVIFKYTLQEWTIVFDLGKSQNNKFSVK